ncbi:helix-turn-helix transcriptional regulator [Tessaracoccus sp. HDW20]|uniref:helix-turn-helix domain-containing protein n=1 Tax=Tessaracoccus coleopterorum TaxID=2714950 RepID=UPI0018D469F9|nr:helix-turn-helix transcriptional regulator [Tessaracoccus coleopterorum]
MLSARKRSGVTREELAAKVGTSVATVARLELKNAVPRFKVMVELCRTLGIDLESAATAVNGQPSQRGSRQPEPEREP